MKIFITKYVSKILILSRCSWRLNRDQNRYSIYNQNDDILLHGNKKNVIIWGTGKPKREFLFVDDLADALVFLMKKYNQNHHINVGSGNEISILNLAKTIGQVIGFKGKFIFDKSKPDGTPRKLINSKKINSLGWKSKTNLLDGIKLTYESYLKNKSK